jgi:DNA polymerase elongation subunit (family B)
MNKIDVITGYVEMARICSVPISFLVFRGQGIKLTSFVAKSCLSKNTLMPDLEKVGDADGYEGAIVLPPKCSMYMDNPVACVDYSSLYPSAMISQNFSHDSKVWTKEYDLDGVLIRTSGECDSTGKYLYDNLPGYHYIDMEFDTFKYIRKSTTSAAIKTKVGKKVCRWAQFPDNKMGILPSILEELLRARKDTRNMIKTEKDPFMQNILDKRQLGYKVTANSLYGQCGSRTSTFYEKDIAASTTATGRMMITYAKRMIEEVYGDRVYETAMHGPVRTKAEYIYGDSVAEYTPVYVRVGGCFDICTISELANKYGNGIWTNSRGKDFCELDGVETWTENGWTRLERVIRHELAPHKRMIRILTHTGMVDVTDDHSLIRIDGSEVSPKDVSVGTELLHHELPKIFNNSSNITTIIASKLTQCVKVADGEYNYTFCVDNKDEYLFAAEIYYYIQMLNKYHTSISASDLANTYIISMSTCVNTTNPNAIKQMHDIPYFGYVYDLTTANHHFAAGVGNMIVHNTDSVFFTFNLENPNTGEKIRGKPALEMTIEIAQDAAELCSKWLKSPMELSYEKTLMPFILLSKKRYVGMLYETDPNKGKLKYMGLSLKRRDSCDYLKDVYGQILNILMNTSGENNISDAIQFLDYSLNELAEGRVSMDKLMITKALRSYYKKPEQIGHKVLADRIAKRDPGNKPKSGDRMRFLFVVNKNLKALMGDKIETPEFINSCKLQIDYTHYITNQLMKPLQQLFGLALEQIWELQKKGKAIKEFRRELAQLDDAVGLDNLEKYMKEKEKLCSAKVKVLLFDKVLSKIYNEKNKIQTITSFFGKV